MVSQDEQGFLKNKNKNKNKPKLHTDVICKNNDAETRNCNKPKKINRVIVKFTVDRELAAKLIFCFTVTAVLYLSPRHVNTSAEAKPEVVSGGGLRFR